MHVEDRCGEIEDAFDENTPLGLATLKLLQAIDERLHFNIWSYKSHFRLVLTNSKIGGKALIAEVLAREKERYSVSLYHPQPIASVAREGIVTFDAQGINETACLVIELIEAWHEHRKKLYRESQST